MLKVINVILIIVVNVLLSILIQRDFTMIYTCSKLNVLSVICVLSVIINKYFAAEPFLMNITPLAYSWVIVSVPPLSANVQHFPFLVVQNQPLLPLSAIVSIYQAPSPSGDGLYLPPGS